MTHSQLQSWAGGCQNRLFEEVIGGYTIHSLVSARGPVLAPAKQEQ